jgi:hypothetical protein
VFWCRKLYLIGLTVFDNEHDLLLITFYAFIYFIIHLWLLQDDVSVSDYIPLKDMIMNS